MSKNNNPTKDRFYIAYGSNLNLGQMARRCPTAEAVKATYLHNYRAAKSPSSSGGYSQVTSTVSTFMRVSLIFTAKRR